MEIHLLLTMKQVLYPTLQKKLPLKFSLCQSLEKATAKKEISLTVTLNAGFTLTFFKA